MVTTLQESALLMKKSIERRSKMKKERWDLQSTVNTRDLSGYTGEDGKITGSHMVRSDYFSPMTLQDQKTLLDRDLRCVIDLRGEEEYKNLPDVFAKDSQVIYHHIPLMDEDMVNNWNERTKIGGAMFLMEDSYIDMLDNRQEAMRAVFQAMLDTPQGRTMYHCTAGKDRTGVVSALLLSLVGVSDADVVEDYALTNEFLQPIIPRLQAEAGNTISKEEFENAVGAPKGNMEKMLAHLYQKYGSAEKYFNLIGFTAAQIDTLKGLMFEKMND